MPSLKWIPDTTGCKHSFEDPVKKKGAVEYGWCAACQSRVAVQLNQLDVSPLGSRRLPSLLNR